MPLLSLMQSLFITHQQNHPLRAIQAQKIKPNHWIFFTTFNANNCFESQKLRNKKDMTTKQLLMVLFCMLNVFAFAQKTNLPKNPKAGTCYEQCFDRDKKIEWKEVPCIRKDRVEEASQSTASDCNTITAYQKELIANGYTVALTGCLNQETIDAHHRYLRKRQKAARKAKRKKKETTDNS